MRVRVLVGRGRRRDRESEKAIYKQNGKPFGFWELRTNRGSIDFDRSREVHESEKERERTVLFVSFAWIAHCCQIEPVGAGSSDGKFPESIGIRVIS